VMGYGVGEELGDAAGERALEWVGLSWVCYLVDEAAIAVADALGYGDDRPALLRDDAVETGEELIHVKGALGNVDQVRRVLLIALARGSGRRQPSHAAAHGFQNGDRLRQGTDIQPQVARGLGNVAGRAGVAWATIRNGNVVIDGLGNAQHAHVIGGLGGLPAMAADRLGPEHGAVAAGEEDVVNVVLAQALEEALQIVLRRLGARGAKRRAGSCAEQVKVSRREVAEVDGGSIGEALEAEPCAEDAGELAVRMRFFDDCGKGRVEDLRRSAALHDQQIARRHLRPDSGRCCAGRAAREPSAREYRFHLAIKPAILQSIAIDNQERAGTARVFGVEF